MVGCRFGQAIGRALCGMASAFVLVIAVPSVGSADILVTAAPTSTYKPLDTQGDDDLWDLDHHYMFTWKIPSVDLKGGALVDSGGNVVAGAGATLTFQNMYNWNSDPNSLFMHLLDTASTLSCPSPPCTLSTFGASDSDPSGTYTAPNGSAVSWYTDDATTIVTGLNDNFVSNPTWMAPAGTSRTALDAQSFPGLGGSPVNGANPGPYKTGFAVLPASGPLVGGTWYYKQDGTKTTTSGTYNLYDYTYVFTNAQVQALAAYMAPGSAGGSAVAFGFDPDCHYWNDSIAFNVFTGTVPPPVIPEPSTLLLMGSGLLMAAKRYRRKTKLDA